MKLRIYSIILFLNSYLTGLLTPVISLVLISKGASLSNLSIILGLYALTVILLELPSGIFADVYGRKKTFVASLVMFVVSFSILLIGKGFVVLCIVMMLYGVGRAFASGSFDALFIDYYIDNYGKDKMHSITTRLSVLEALGLSAGALTGGLFPYISKNFLSLTGMYDLNIIIRIILTAILIIISVIFISDATIEEDRQPSIKQQIKISSSFVFENKTVLCIFLSVFSTGFFLSALETYWQPHIITLMPDNSKTWLLGIMAFLYLGSAMTGSILFNKSFKKHKYNIRKSYIILRSLLAAFLIFTALQTNIPIFIISYASIYLLFGMATIPEGMILNSETPNNIRASVLSVNSFTMQIGGLTGSVLYSMLIKFISIPSIWMLAASVVLIITILIANKFINFGSVGSIEVKN